MQLISTLTFNGQCEEAFKFYEQCFGGRIQTMMTWGDSPLSDKVPSEWRGKIIHASLIVGRTTLMGSDAPADRYATPRGFSVTIDLDNTADAERIFKALSKDGTVQMPLEQTFWAARFGMCVDRFGIPWMINAGRPA